MHNKFYPYFVNPGSQVQSAYYSRGVFSFAEHLGKPLSDKLWSDLIDCLHIKRLSVFMRSMPGKVSECPESVAIYLTDFFGEWVVDDIVYQPHYS